MSCEDAFKRLENQLQRVNIYIDRGYVNKEEIIIYVNYSFFTYIIEHNSPSVVCVKDFSQAKTFYKGFRIIVKSIDNYYNIKSYKEKGVIKLDDYC